MRCRGMCRYTTRTRSHAHLRIITHPLTPHTPFPPDSSCRVINTNPENFVWRRTDARSRPSPPACTGVTFGFFTRKKPSVQLLVNGGEPVLSAVNSASYAVHHSSGRLAAVGPHPAGNVTGLTLIDYLALPPKARISCSYQGEEGGEGFLGAAQAVEKAREAGEQDLSLRDM